MLYIIHDSFNVEMNVFDVVNLRNGNWKNSVVCLASAGEDVSGGCRSVCTRPATVRFSNGSHEGIG